MDQVESGLTLEATLPPMWHWAYLLPDWRQSELGTDGHPTAGLPAPPAPGQRRMFAGGRTTHHNRLVIGPPARKSSYVTSTTEKTGRSGVLTFVTVRHEIEQMGMLCVTEEQDIVYRAPSPGGAAAAQVSEPPRQADVELDFDVDPVVLFRFSSVTRNAHRIHYDLPYAAVEGYADLVVHGPLQIVLMAGVLRQLGLSFEGREFSYRLQAPAIGAQRLVIRGCREGWAEVRNASGSLTAVAELAPAS